MPVERDAGAALQDGLAVQDGLAGAGGRIVREAVVVGVALFLLYMLPWRGPGWVPAAFTSRDSLGNRLLAASLATRGATDLSPWFEGEIPAMLREQVLVERAAPDGGAPRLVPRFPAGTGLLAVPFFLGVPASAAAHTSARVAPLSTLVVREHLAAAAMTALMAALFFALVRGGAAGGASRHDALLLTLALGVASPVWSANAQGLWAQTGSTLATVAMAVLVVGAWRASPRRAPWLFASAGLAAGVAAWCRPTHLATIGVVVLALAAMRAESDDALTWRRRLTARAFPFALGALLPLGVMALFHWRVYGSLAGPYFADVFDLWSRGARMERNVFEAFAGTLLSSACGLLPYCPFVLLVLGSDAFRWRGTALARLALLLAATHALILWRHPVWWGGWSWGPRLFVDALPWIVLLCLPMARSLRERRRAVLSWVLVSIGAAAAWLGVARFDYGWFFRHPDLATDRAPLWSLRDSPLLDTLRRGRPLLPPRAPSPDDWTATTITPRPTNLLGDGAWILHQLDTQRDDGVWADGAGLLPAGAMQLWSYPGAAFTAALQFQDRMYLPMPAGLAGAPMLVVGTPRGTHPNPPSSPRVVAGLMNPEGGSRGFSFGPSGNPQNLCYWQSPLDATAPYLVIERRREPDIGDPLATLPPIETVMFPVFLVPSSATSSP